MSVYGLRPKAFLSAVIAIAVTAGIVVSAAWASDTKPRFPRTLQGIWYDDDRAGHVQCQGYKKAEQANDHAVSGLLVGAVLINDSIMHSYSEYGEGNFYELRRLKKTDRNIWIAGVAIGIDTLPKATQGEDDILTLQLTKATLTVKTKSDFRDLKDSWSLDYKLRRCADVPVGFYRRNAG
jgi:hypothetical protein